MIGLSELSSIELAWEILTIDRMRRRSSWQFASPEWRVEMAKRENGIAVEFARRDDLVRRIESMTPA